MTRRIVRSQQETEPSHNNSFCEDQPENWGKIPGCPIPQFAGGFPQVKVVKFTMHKPMIDLFLVVADFNLLNPVADLDVGDWTNDHLPL